MSETNDQRIYDRCLIRVGQLESENVKLRELVRFMWLYDYAGRFSTKQEDMEHVAMVYQRMRELGVEVS